jgi:hypothetical protein
MRKTESNAVADIADDAGLKLDFLWRNPLFRADVEAVNAMPRRSHKEVAARAKVTETLKEKWKLDGFVFPITRPISADDRNLIRAPVRPRLANETLTVEIDLSCPVETVMALIEREITSARKRANIQKGRRRLDKAQAQITIYDAVMRHRTYSAAAKELKQPVRRVMAAFRIAWDKIHDDAFPGKRAAKRKQLTSGFDAKTHIETCPECRAIGMCSLAWEYVNQDESALFGKGVGEIKFSGNPLQDWLRTEREQDEPKRLYRGVAKGNH